MIDPDEPVLTINGQDYTGWMGLTVDRRLEHMATHLELNIAESWGENAAPWQIQKFNPFTLSFGSDLVMTGYIDEYQPAFDENSHNVRASGRSKTADLIDCSPDIKSGQFKGYGLAQIARSVCQPFGITVLDQANSSVVFPDATLQRSETAFTFLQRLGRLSSVLLTDNEQGNLVLTQTGTTRSSATLAQGVNIKRASGQLNGQKQHSIYIVLGQNAISTANSTVTGFGDAQSSGGSITPAVATQLRATAIDTSVPRYRPRTTFAEAQLNAAGMQARANWERNYAFGRSTQLDVTVVGWRQPDRTLWKNNQIIPVFCPFLEIDQDLLIVGTKFTIDPKLGRSTVLTVAPPEGYTPEPGQVKSKVKKGKKGGTLSSGYGDS